MSVFRAVNGTGKGGRILNIQYAWAATLIDGVGVFGVVFLLACCLQKSRKQRGSGVKSSLDSCSQKQN